MKMNVRPKNISCDDIYSYEMDRSIKTLKRFREAWLRSSSTWNTELFQYADSDFYFYRFAVERQEKNTEELLTNILYRILERYKYNFEIPEHRYAPFVFILCEDEKRIGFRFDDFYADEDINDIVEEYGLINACIIRTWNPERTEEWIIRENRNYEENEIKLKTMTIKDFFDTYLGTDEYNLFVKHLNAYLNNAREITGYKSIKFLSSMNLAAQKLYEEKILADWPYKEYRYEVIDVNNEKLQKYHYLSKFTFSNTTLKRMIENYVSDKLYRTMIGTNEYAESFITSEWLFHSLKEKKNFDYTSVISGYLKSIEQLLFKIVMLNVNNGCKISMSRASDIIEEAKKNNVIAYGRKKGKWKEFPIKENGYNYIELTDTQSKYMDSSIGTFEFFLRNNPHIFIENSLAEIVADMVSCFRTECRNGYFHTHNLKEWTIVEKTRDNAIYLYFILLGTCIIPSAKYKDLVITEDDSFDELCKKIREFRHYNTAFVFEYADGRRMNLIYDFLNNTIEYSDDGIEHYRSLLFYKVKDFSLESYEALDAGIKDEQKMFLTRDSIPYKIFGVHRNHELEEIVF